MRVCTPCGLPLLEGEARATIRFDGFVASPGLNGVEFVAHARCIRLQSTPPSPAVEDLTREAATVTAGLADVAAWEGELLEESARRAAIAESARRAAIAEDREFLEEVAIAREYPAGCDATCALPGGHLAQEVAR